MGGGFFPAGGCRWPLLWWAPLSLGVAPVPGARMRTGEPSEAGPILNDGLPFGDSGRSDIKALLVPASLLCGRRSMGWSVEPRRELRKFGGAAPFR